MDVVVGSVDAAIVWNTTVAQFTELEAVHLAEFKDQIEDISATVLSTSKSPTDALRFARYLAARDRGSVVFERFGCEPTNGDVWAWKPEMILYSGGVNRPAIEPLLQEFSQREGVQMTTIFNGCGILCATMQTMKDSAPSQFPDAYYACDLCFVPPVAKQFPEAVLLTETEIGMIVPAGNPKNIRTLADLAQPYLRVGLCNQRQSTLGYMTAGMLRSAGLTDSVQKNVVVEVPTADFLINQMRSGALDAAIVYRVNALLQSDHLDFIEIDHPGAKAVQPFSVAVDSPRRQLAGRLLDFLKRHRRQFEDSGFSWRGDSVAVKSDQIEVPPWLRSPQALPQAAAK
jgi:ABC-type molybdate transport system substrate-binding protein